MAVRVYKTSTAALAGFMNQLDLKMSGNQPEGSFKDKRKKKRNFVPVLPKVMSIQPGQPYVGDAFGDNINVPEGATNTQQLKCLIEGSKTKLFYYIDQTKKSLMLSSGSHDRSKDIAIYGPTTSMDSKAKDHVLQDAAKRLKVPPKDIDISLAHNTAKVSLDETPDDVQPSRLKQVAKGIGGAALDLVGLKPLRDLVSKVK